MISTIHTTTGNTTTREKDADNLIVKTLFKYNEFKSEHQAEVKEDANAILA